MDDHYEPYSNHYRINSFISFRIIIEIPAPLTLIGVKDISNGKFGTINYSPDLNTYNLNDYLKSFYIVFENDLLAQNNINNGDVVQITFKVSCSGTRAADCSLRTRIETTDADLKITSSDTSYVDTYFRVTPIQIGDINKDGTVSQTDRIILTRYLAGWDTDASKYSLLAADIDGDGKVTQADRTLLSRYVANWYGTQWQNYLSNK